MKNPLEITQDVLNGMIGIGGIPTNQEFYDEFNDRLKVALSLHNVSQQRKLLLDFLDNIGGLDYETKPFKQIVSEYLKSNNCG